MARTPAMQQALNNDWLQGQGVPSMSIPLYAGMDVPMLGFLPRILGGVRTLVLGS